MRNKLESVEILAQDEDEDEEEDGGADDEEVDEVQPITEPPE